MFRFIFSLLILSSLGQAATIAIIDTGFDLDHEYLRPKILQQEIDDEAIDYQGWDFFDNSHLKKAVIEDRSSVQEILLYRNLRAKGHRQGLSLDEFEWYKKRSADKNFMEKVRLFKKHSHGTFVAGIALREGENINIFPIRGLNLPNPVVAVEDNTIEGITPIVAKTPEEKFQEEIKQSINRVSKKFSKICNFVNRKKIEIINASYGITYKNIMTKLRERHKEITGKEIEETRLKILVDDYFKILYERGSKTISKYPNILFIFSAGNSGLDNDQFHHYPSRIKISNTITVAALNGDYLATFSNYGAQNVDIGAPGVAILSLVPKVYSEDGRDLYSPASGTSMAAPYVSNLAAQIKNTNPNLSAGDIKKLIMETGDLKEHLKLRLISSAVVNNNKALRAALLSKDMPIDQAISLGRSDLIPMEDRINMGLAPAISPEDIQKKVMETIPSVITPQETDDQEFTKSSSSLPMHPEKALPDNLGPPLLEAPDVQAKSADLIPSNQNAEQSPLPSEETPASFSQPQSLPPEAQSPASVPSSQQ